MLGGPPNAPWTPSESKDGYGSGDHDELYTWGNLPTVDNHWQFSTRQFVLLMCLKSHIYYGDRRYFEEPA